MDTMFWTKVTGGICGSLLFFMMISWGAEEMYHVGGHDKGHGDEHADDHGDDHGDKADALAWIIVDEGEEAVEEEVIEVAFVDVFATADAGAGERVFSKCKACHKLEDGANGVGPHLYSIVDRAIGKDGAFGYSNVLAESTDAWTPENLNAFLENPKGWAPGTKMNFAGLNKIEDRANLIAYLATIGG